MSNSGEIWVIGEQRRGRLEEVSLELLSKGTALSQRMGVTLSAVLLGDEVEEVARVLAPVAIPSGCSCDEQTINVSQGYCQPINFGLANKVKLAPA